MIEFLKRHRVVRAVLGGTAVVGAGAATGQAAIRQDSSTPPKKVSLGQSTKLTVEGTQVQVPPSTELPHDVLDHPTANAAPDSPASPDSVIHNSTAVGVNTTANTPHVNTTANTPHVNTTANTPHVNTTANTPHVNTTANTPHVNTTANTPHVNTTANTANTVSADEVHHHGPGRLDHEGGDHRGPGHDGGDHHGPAPASAPASHDGGDRGGGDRSGDHGGSSGSGGGGGD